jgi:putative membrane protein
MYPWNDGWGVGAWIAMMLAMVMFWGFVAVMVVYVIRGTGNRGDLQPPAALKGDGPLRILDERFARGEIDPGEYAERRELLRGR